MHYNFIKAKILPKGILCNPPNGGFFLTTFYSFFDSKSYIFAQC